MIRIDRSEEPAELRKARRRRLAQAWLAYKASSQVVFDDYDVARTALYDAQGRKCAYCERQQGLEGQAVEHFRPKGGVDGGDPRRYFWLAWTWKNLLFACTTCNCKPLKGNKFPLEPGTLPLPLPTCLEVLAGQGPAFDLEAEHPMLIDPSREDPMDHIVWRPENLEDAPGALRWRPMHKSLRGKEVIGIFQLRGDLAVQAGDYIISHVQPDIVSIRFKMVANDRDGIQRKWRGLLRKLFSKLAPYQAASYGALDFLVSADDRKMWGLDLPRPGRRAEPHVSRELADSPKLAQMPEWVRLEVRADKMNTDQLVLMLCRQCPWTEPELVQVLDRAAGTIAAARRTLVTAKQLKSTPGGFVTIP